LAVVSEDVRLSVKEAAVMESPSVRADVNEVFDRLSELTGVTPPCPFCTHTEWTRTALGRILEIRALSTEDATAEPMFTIALGFTCVRCGFVRIHEVDPAAWGLPATE
jgi:hypothetical protein